MKIIFLEWNSFGNADILEAFSDLGHEVIRYPFSNKIDRTDAAFENALESRIRQCQPDYMS